MASPPRLKMASNPGLFAAILVALCSIILSLATASAESLATADADAAADPVLVVAGAYRKTPLGVPAMPEVSKKKAAPTVLQPVKTGSNEVVNRKYPAYEEVITRESRENRESRERTSGSETAGLLRKQKSLAFEDGEGEKKVAKSSTTRKNDKFLESVPKVGTSFRLKVFCVIFGSFAIDISSVSKVGTIFIHFSMLVKDYSLK